MAKPNFVQRLKATPTKPGVYVMRDGSREVLYVGKAANLRSRLRSYFASPSGMAPKIRSMVEKVADFDFIVAESDQEALLLEANLIKRHQPQFNARLKDDKNYLYIKIDVAEDFPQVYLTRRVSNDGARYFGPFASAKSVRQTLALLKKLFPYRSCTKAITGTDPRPCLDFYINRCVGPCIGAVDGAQYREVIDQVIMFMGGKTDTVVKAIGSRMSEASDELQFERAAVLRDQLRAIERVNEGQRVLEVSSEDLDVIAIAEAENEAWVEVFFVRTGKLVGRDGFMMVGTEAGEPGETMTAFVKQFYDANPHVPSRVLVQHPVHEADAIQRWLTAKRGTNVQVYVPERGKKRRLVQMVAENAVQGLEQRRAKESVAGGMESAMPELQEALGLPRLPERIECYDISNTQGTNPVGSMVVFVDGKRKSSDYRRFKIRTVEGVDDYSMMREVLSRRFKRIARSKEEATNGVSEPADPKDQAWQKVPDLVLIDGGKGHLGAALQVFLELGIDFIPLASLAKENEELFVPQVPEPILLPRDSRGLYLVQQLRDEAHRFAITYHRQRRSKASVRSAVDQIPGIGPKRRRMLLQRFGSVSGIREAAVDQIASIPGMTMPLARTVKEYL